MKVFSHTFVYTGKLQETEEKSEILKALQGNESRSAKQEESRGEVKVQWEMLLVKLFSLFDDFLTFSCFWDVGVLSWRKLWCMLSFFLWMFSISVNVSYEHERRRVPVELLFLSRSSATSLMPWRDTVQP